MNFVDSCGWLEYFADGSYADYYAPAIEDTGTLIEVGHATQNIHLQATALGLGTVPIGAFDDQKVSALLNLLKSEAPLYIIPVGRP
jgi:nitroreductase